MTVIIEVPKSPAFSVSEAGFAVIEKSGGAAGVASACTAALAEAAKRSLPEYTAVICFALAGSLSSASVAVPSSFTNADPKDDPPLTRLTVPLETGAPEGSFTVTVKVVVSALRATASAVRVPVVWL